MNQSLTRAVDPRHLPEAIAERILPADLRRGWGVRAKTPRRFSPPQHQG
jgi:hypothetical protein